MKRVLRVFTALLMAVIVLSTTVTAQAASTSDECTDFYAENLTIGNVGEVYYYVPANWIAQPEDADNILYMLSDGSGYMMAQSTDLGDAETAEEQDSALGWTIFKSSMLSSSAYDYTQEMKSTRVIINDHLNGYLMRYFARTSGHSFAVTQVAFVHGTKLYSFSMLQEIKDQYLSDGDETIARHSNDFIQIMTSMTY